MPINTKNLIAFDFETSGTEPEYALQPWRVAQDKAWITSIAIAERQGNEIKTFGTLNPDVDYLKAFLEDAITNDKQIVGWNTVFDIAWLLAYGLEDLVMQAQWLDGMLLWRHHAITPEYDIDRTKKQSYSLKNCVRLLEPESAGYEENIDFHTSDPEKLEQLHEYNIKDTVFTLKFTEHWIGKLKESQATMAKLEADSLPLIAYANYKGIRIDRLAVRELQEHLANVASSQLDALQQHNVTKEILQSPTQLAKLLFDDWNLPVFKITYGKKTAKTSRSTDKEVLQRLAKFDSRAAAIRSYREALNNKTKFADAPLASIEYNEDGCTHPQARIYGTYSGRVTYDSKQGRNKGTRQIGFALHQEKRSSLYRSIVLPPEDYMLVEFDAAGQEFRWMAIASRDPTMLSLCEEGQDPHMFMGAAIVDQDYDHLCSELKSGNPEAKNIRQLGKLANLSLQYRTSAKKLMTVAEVQYNIILDEKLASRIHQTYRKVYSNVPEYWRLSIAFAREHKYVTTFGGREINIDGDWNEHGWALGSTAINFRIQGTGADQKYVAMSALRPYMVAQGIRFAWDLHDGIYLYVPKDKVKEAAAHMKAELDGLNYNLMWNFKPPIPLPWDCKVGPSWGLLEEFRL